MTIIARRAAAANAAFDVVKNFYFNSRYGERRTDPGIADFTFGNPHEMPLDGIVAPDGVARILVGDRDRFSAPGGHRYAAAPLASRRVRAVGESRPNAPAHRHRAGDAFDRTRQLAHRRQLMIGKGHRVDDPDRALAGGERGLEHVGARQVAARRLEWNLRLQLEAAASVLVEDGGEDTR